MIESDNGILENVYRDSDIQNGIDDDDSDYTGEHRFQGYYTFSSRIVLLIIIK